MSTAQDPADPTLSINIFDAHKRNADPHSSHEIIWHPLDTLGGTVIVAGAASTSWQLESLHIRFEGTQGGRGIMFILARTYSPVS